MNIDNIISMAWSDKISFEEIKKRTNLSEKQVISIMRKNLKKKSYILWRKRVRGRITKHRKLMKTKVS
ncbi:MAG: TIGR03643 family protein [Candidatus Pelagibacter sp. TMED64]|nr:TIGR03643 family protein [Candidatus Pelagibacter sp.]OUU66281.1 MAG: TIGR03643 family protein [Candidatus Pelagibacter sp. TMED64]|tara:strand:+ start:75 stop:278 length:204 start_codon:yes stop_codon:yes gene_type:complete